MVTNEPKIQCPSCGESISIDDALTRQIKEKITKDFEATQKIKEQEITLKLEEIKRQEADIAEKKKNIESVIETQVSDKLNTERTTILKDAKIEAEKAQNAKTTFLEDQLKEKDEKLQQATKNEVELLKEKTKLENDKKSFELEKLRQLEEDRKTIEEEAARKAAEKEQYNVAQLKKQLADAAKANEDLRRKLEQGSQKTQGQVLELELEELLKSEFIQDQILPVPVGVNGADIIQKVIDRIGRTCGQIIWETKKTKSWQENWIQKLKDDQRAIKADIAVIVSATLPDDVKGFAFRDGVWICDIKLIIPLATSIRMNLEALAREKSMSIGKNEKMEVLYNYLTGIEFKQRVEAIMEAFTSMELSLKKERMVYEKIWAEREKQLKKIMINTVGMHGDLSGLISLPQINMIELDGIIVNAE